MDFRDFVDQLDSEDEVLWIKSEVNTEYELSSLLQQAEARRKAIWFEQVKDADFPAVGGIMNTPERHALALGRSPQTMQQSGAWAEVIANARANPLPAKILPQGTAAEVKVTGKDIDINRLPVPVSFPDDTHRFLTSGLGVVMDPETGIQNVGFYRAPIIDGQTISISAGASSQLNKIYQATAATGTKLSIAYVIGAPPALLITAGCRIQRDESDMDIAGALQGKPLELMKCQTSDLLVPANAEFIIEAEVELGNLVEHTMGEFPDNYGTTRSPIAKITAITHRSDAVYHCILGGMNREHNALGGYMFAGLRETLLEQLQAKFPCLRDIHIDMRPPRMGNRCQIAVTTQNSAEGEPQQLIDALYACKFDSFPLLMVAQRVVVVDEDINIQSADDVEWAIAMRVGKQNKFRIIESEIRPGVTVVCLAIDATVSEEFQAKTKRPRISGADKYHLNNYL